METKFTNKQIAAWRRVAMNVNSDVIKRAKIKSKIDELQAEFDTLTASIDLYEAPVKLATGGYTTSDIFEKVITDTGKIDKNGNAVKTTEYKLKWPDTVLPPVENAEETPNAENSVSNNGIDPYTQTVD